MKNPYILSAVIAVLIFAGCGKENVETHPTELGRIDAQFGRNSYYLINELSRKVIQTLPYKNQEYAFKIELETFGNNGFNDFYFFQKLDVNLKDIAKGQVYHFDGTSTSHSREKLGGIHFEYHETIGDRNLKKVYYPLLGKSNVWIRIDNIKYENFATPAVEGEIKGYLYNKEDVQDSLLIDVKFLTEPLRSSI